MKKLPQFKTLDELVAFWDKHDFADYMDEMEEADPDEARPGYRQTREYDFTVIFWREAADGYRAYVPALPGREAHGETLEEVTTNIR
ncbi:MAG: hypothetical protein L0332_26910 [Chloroflexi bacterium]|nr:hypothetical protein [Chloroflexota bacterium]MCI0580819.1 hypothetical protein [Chloroflexota bacterium]MCI0648187.1 hypothetical protein [Chloroflexota bacterium]MCI0730329.1 hypothetical protein [Chloroflexota bacterium]